MLNLKQIHALTVLPNKHCYVEAPLQQSKHMQQSLHTQTQRKNNLQTASGSEERLYHECIKEKIHWGNYIRRKREIATLSKV